MATVYGDNKIFESCRTAVYNLLDALKTAMEEAGTDPALAAVYSGHEQIKMTLPAASADFEGIIDDGGGRYHGSKAEVAGHIINARYPILISVRVHTDYQDGYRDKVKLARLLNSVNNYLWTHKPSIDASGVVKLIHHVGEVTTDDVFQESLTIGGQINVLIIVNVSHTQA
ncbi:MAG: hypothetical protein JSU85_13920 [Candidatus Zixiibacteriota bacterium]|nr:MAG: hypothetical protein JSU85_13920 [candidate division Zixibacteria bacterium]